MRMRTLVVIPATLRLGRPVYYRTVLRSTVLRLLRIRFDNQVARMYMVCNSFIHSCAHSIPFHSTELCSLGQSKEWEWGAAAILSALRVLLVHCLCTPVLSTCTASSRAAGSQTCTPNGK